MSKPEGDNLGMKRSQKLKHNRLEGRAWIGMVEGNC